MGQLKELSKINLEDFRRDFVLRDNVRYHAINWNSKNIPLQRKDLDWVSKDVLNNPEEFEFFQFHISKALGRVVGYWQPLNVFNVVLFDPMHNIQPSKRNDYKIRACFKVEDDISTLLHRIDAVKQIDCKDENCRVKAELLRINLVDKDSNAVLFFLDNDFLSVLNDYCEKNSLSPVVEKIIMEISS